VSAQDFPAEVADLFERSDLTDQEREVLRVRTGVDRGSPRTLLEAGRVLDLDMEQVARIERAAIEKLKAVSS